VLSPCGGVRISLNSWAKSEGLSESFVPLSFVFVFRFEGAEVVVGLLVLPGKSLRIYIRSVISGNVSEGKGFSSIF
jgi:hypothetical protein